MSEVVHAGLDDAEERKHEGTLGWLNEQLDRANQLLEGWSAVKNDARRIMDAKRWESETYEGLGRRVPHQQAHFRVEVNFGPEWFPQWYGLNAYEDNERAMLRRRTHRLTEIIDRVGLSK